MSAVEKVFHSGEVIISEGHFASSLFVIRKGRVDVIKRGANKQEVLIAQLGPGEFFGEMSLLDPEHSIHSATIRAAEDTTVAITDRGEFDRYLGHMTPGMKGLLLHLVQKLRETTDKLCNLHGESKKSK
jgi:CRP/FNR family transcriptional regulator, cyclic AMP receptor protein